MKKIILVDDFKDFADVVRDYIKGATKQEVLAFYNPKKVLEYLENNKDIDIFISDYEMPGMNGFELAKKVTQMFPNIKIVIWSGHDESTLKKVNQNYNLDVKLLSKSDCNELVKYIIATRSDLN